MSTIVIIEDEKPAARRLQRMLNSNDFNVDVLLHSVAESIAWFKENSHPDLIFSDIQLSDGLCFDIFEQVKVNSPIIFTTAYDKYALKAFKLNSIDYLLKPIDKNELVTALHKYKKNKNHQLFDITNLRDMLFHEKKIYKNRFTVEVGQHLKIIEAKEIECFCSEEHASIAYLTNGKSYLINGSLESIFQTLDPNYFFKVSRKSIINISAIKDIISYTNSRLQIKLNRYNESPIIVSREKVKDFKIWIS